MHVSVCFWSFFCTCKLFATLISHVDLQCFQLQQNFLIVSEGLFTLSPTHIDAQTRTQTHRINNSRISFKKKQLRQNTTNAVRPKDGKRDNLQNTNRQVQMVKTLNDNQVDTHKAHKGTNGYLYMRMTTSTDRMITAAPAPKPIRAANGKGVRSVSLSYWTSPRSTSRFPNNT